MDRAILDRFRTRAFAVDAVTAAVLLILSQVDFGLDLNSPSSSTAFFAVVAVLLRREFPPVSLALVWVMAGIQVIGNERPNVTAIALVLVLYSCASRGSRSVLVASFVSAVLGGGFASIYLARTGSRFTLFLSGSPWQAFAALLAPMGLLAFAWLAGLTVRAFRSRGAESALRAAAQSEATLAQSEASRAQTEATLAQTEASRAQTEAVQALDLAQAERVRAAMARDVHDIVGHSLAVIIAQADSVQFLDDTDRIRSVTSTIAETARRSLGEVRDVLSGTAGSAGAGGADEPHDIEALLTQVRAAGVVVDHRPRGTARALDPALAIVVRRVAQEMLANALRHGAPGRPISFAEVWRQNDLVLQVDNEVLVDAATERAIAVVTPGGGVRVDASAATGAPSTGLKGMQARVAAVGGSLEAEAVDDTFTARARIPLPPLTEESA